ncbi:MAG: HflC protein [Thiothrix nivea]|nr:MAG: HflC protein [Thiothrix nivea]
MKKNMIIGALLLLVVLIYSSAYTVDQREKAIKFKFREIVDADIKPGLHFRIPFIESVSKFPAQILTLDAKTERFLTGEKKYVLVDFFVKWRISDVATFYRATSGGRMTAAASRLEDIMKDGLRNEFSRRTIEEALSEQRDEIMQGLEVKSNEAARQLGITVVDVRVSKIDFPEQVSESVFQRMRSERMRVAQDFRSRGREEAEKIKAAADRQATIIMAEAYRDSEKTRGEGDARAAETYAKAFSQDKDFYSFYRSLDAYRKTLGKEGDMMVLEPDSEFFRFFGNQHVGKPQPQPSASVNNNPVVPEPAQDKQDKDNLVVQ